MNDDLTKMILDPELGKLCKELSMRIVQQVDLNLAPGASMINKAINYYQCMMLVTSQMQTNFVTAINATIEDHIRGRPPGSP